VTFGYSLADKNDFGPEVDDTFVFKLDRMGNSVLPA
jgi:hypothetical protein